MIESKLESDRQNNINMYRVTAHVLIKKLFSTQESTSYQSYHMIFFVKISLINKHVQNGHKTFGKNYGVATLFTMYITIP